MCAQFVIPVVAEKSRRNSDESSALCGSELIVSVCDKLRAHASRITLFRDVYSTRTAAKPNDLFTIKRLRTSAQQIGL
jgi:hypothetical protein